MRRFEYHDEKSNKFWEVGQDSSTLSIRWGKTGTNGQSQTKEFADDAKAASAMLKLINEKTGKGYTEVALSADATTVAAPAKPEPAQKTEKAKVTPPPEPEHKKQAEAPPESNDDQAGRAFVSVLQQISDGAFKEDRHISAARIRRDHGVSETAAQQVIQRLISANLAWRYGSATCSINQQAAHHAEELRKLFSAATPEPAEPEMHISDDAPPWLAQGTPLRLMPEMMCHALPSRRFPQPVRQKDAQRLWLTLREKLEKKVHLDIEGSDAELRQAVEETAQRFQSRKMEGSPESDAILVAIGLSEGYRSEGVAPDIFCFLAGKAGLAGALDAYLDAQRITVEHDYRHKKLQKSFSQTVQEAYYGRYYAPMADGDWIVRAWLAAAPEDEYRLCVEKIRATLPQLHTERQAQLALLLPDEPEISNEVALRLGGNAKSPAAVHWLQLTANAPEAITATRKVHSEGTFWSDTAMVATLLQERGVDALEILAAGAFHDAAGSALACIGLPDAVEALARAASSSKQTLARFSQAVDRWPAAAMAALAKVSASAGKEASLATPSLTQLLRAHPGLPQQLAPWLDTASNNVLSKLQLRLGGPGEVAGNTELPAVLVSPPWLSQGKKKAVKPLALEPLPLDAMECWHEGEREQLLTIDNEWRRKRLEEAKTNPDLLLSEIGIIEHTSKGAKTDPAAKAALKAQDGLALADCWRRTLARKKANSRYFYHSLDALCLQLLPVQVATTFWNTVVPEALKEGVYIYNSETVNACFGLAVLPALTALTTTRPSENLANTLNFGVVAFALIAARAFGKLKSLRAIGRDWLLRFPEHAICGLIAPAVGKAGEARDCAASALRLLAANGHEPRILEIARNYGQQDVMEAVRAMLDENPLDRFPTKIGKLPEFWQPQNWNRPQLKNGKALPDSALQHLGTMLTFPTNEEVYAGIQTVQTACTADSIAEFMWDAFCAWLHTGAPSKEGWALTMLGYLGTDETARKLTPYIRAWPGEAAHARAVTGLDVLANIGTDVALMLLNGIAQKIKFKGLQDRAREKIDAIAEARGLSTEELEDRLAPDLGLDASGTLLLDFGPRTFKVGFDEALKPYVRELENGREGVRLTDLPKPKKTDDEQLSRDAVDRFKLLKKDARTIASQQVLRLETAMCTQRRWTFEVFRQFLVEHPLVRHLVQRLIWGVYECEPESNFGGALVTCFRVNEEGSFTDANDDDINLPEGENLLVGVPHAIDLPSDVASAFGQLFADYELLQSFPQIGRDTYHLNAPELAEKSLNRWKGAVVPTGRVLGLVNKGWRRGQAQDGGCIWYFNKPLGNGRVIELSLDPGIIVGMVDEYPEQTLQEIKVGKPSSWGELQTPEAINLLDQISASELIRDMEALRA